MFPSRRRQLIIKLDELVQMTWIGKPNMSANVLLTVDEMYRADAAAGISGLELMENAGASVVSEITARWEPRNTLVLCGPGNNGGDGFVIARLLDEAGWPVRVALVGDREALTGDAASNAARWRESTPPVEPSVLDGAELVVDALFGAGLSRSIEGPVAEVIERITAERMVCVAVDMPSGVHGDTGEVMGTAPNAALTVTFFRAKPGHLLMPGRLRCGEVVITDIGIPESVLEDIAPKTIINGPDVWRGDFPWPADDAHKYSRGHAVIFGGDSMPGAARLAALSARRIGAGLATIVVHPDSWPRYAGCEPGTIIAGCSEPAEFIGFLDDPRKNAILIGPGAGLAADTAEYVRIALATGRSTVVDADALSIFAGKRQALVAAITGPCVLTPHEGEFARLFDVNGDRLSRARAAALETGAIVVLKGADTIIAAPDGRAAINGNGSPYLATAGSGDVLAGMIVGLMAQGMGAFEAAAAAVWVHGAAAGGNRPGLIAEDLPGAIPGVLKSLAGAP